MSAPATAPAARWESWHLMLAAPHEPFLAGRLRPWLEAERASGRVRRGFFIRYGPDGGHLRLRLRPGRAADAAALDRAVRRLVAEWLRDGGGAADDPPVRREAYSRAEHYFGETAESVYAELLNEATTRLCLEVLAGPGGESRTRRWLALVGVLHWLLRGAAEGEDEFGAMVEAGRDFAVRASASLRMPLDGRETAPPHPVLDAAVDTAIRRTAPLAADPLARRTARLLRRARARGAAGRGVATHALHLLCNKLGFPLHEEHEMFTALRRLAVPRAAGEAAEPATAITAGSAA